MSTDHNGGNIQNAITLEEHDGSLNAKRVNVVSGSITASSQVTVTLNNTPTVFAVVNTSAAGQASVALDASLAKIGFATVHVGTPTLFAVVNTSAAGVGESMVTLYPGPNQIGSVTVSNPITLNSVVTISPSVNSIGFATVQVASIAAGVNYVGLASVNIGGTLPALVAGTAQVGSVTVSNPITLNSVVTLSPSINSIGFATVHVGTPTLFAVVNTGAPGVGESMVTLFPGPNQIGSVTVSNPVTLNSVVTLSSSINSIGFATVHVGTPTLFAVVNTGAPGVGESMVTLFPGPNQIGSVTVSNPVLLNSVVTLSSSVNSIGFATVQVASIAAGANYIGLASVNVGGTVAVTQSGTWDEVGINDSGNSITVDGSVVVSGNVTLADAKGYVGLTTTTLGVGTQFIGLVTAWSRNAGTTKTLVSLPVGLGANSLSTLAVPTNENKIKVTNFLLSSNVTTEIAIMSGVTYLTGNASLGVTLFPGGGFELPGSPDSPSWIGLPSGALVVEKRDPGGTVSKIGGGVIYFDEA